MTMTNKNDSTEMTVSHGFTEIANLNFLSEAMSDECAGLEFSLDRVKIPSGGKTAFEVPTGDGESTEQLRRRHRLQRRFLQDLSV